MDSAAIKQVSDILRQLNAHLKRCRAGEQILRGYFLLHTNSSGDGIARALNELQSSAEELARFSRQFSKLLSDLAAPLPTAAPGKKEGER